MKYSELKKILTKYGCYKNSEGRNYESWYNPITNIKFHVGRHNSDDVKKGRVLQFYIKRELRGRRYQYGKVCVPGNI